MSGRSTTFSPVVVWHDVECGGYRADLPLWRELARTEPGPVLDVGAGTGRVTLELARAGHAVTALDHEPELLAALRDRAAGLPVETVVADAGRFSLARRFGLVLVPMQTLQLLPRRDGFLACARRVLAPGGLLAIAITAALESFGGEAAALPHPDVGAHDGWRFASQPTTVLALPTATRIERMRRAYAPDGTMTEQDDVIELGHLSVEQLETEGEAAGFAAEPARRIASTHEHVGAEVVLLRG